MEGAGRGGSLGYDAAAQRSHRHGAAQGEPFLDPKREIYTGAKGPTSGPGGAADLYYYWDMFSDHP